MEYEDILAQLQALNEAETPTQERYGVLVNEDGSIETFGPVSLGETRVEELVE